MIHAFGGLYVERGQNLCNPDPLHYILDAVARPIFGRHLYPTLTDKACAIACTIMKQHVFNDGCKRTAMEAARTFLELNGRALSLDQSTVEVALQATACTLSFEGLAAWIVDRTVHV
jgi:death-on-curing family protein